MSWQVGENRVKRGWGEIWILIKVGDSVVKIHITQEMSKQINTQTKERKN